MRALVLWQSARGGATGVVLEESLLVLELVGGGALPRSRRRGQPSCFFLYDRSEDGPDVASVRSLVAGILGSWDFPPSDLPWVQGGHRHDETWGGET
jgi:hypothetical protein